MSTKEQFQASSLSKEKVPPSPPPQNIHQQMGPFTMQYHWGMPEAGGQFMLKTEPWTLPSVHQGTWETRSQAAPVVGPGDAPSGHTLKTTS